MSNHQNHRRDETRRSEHGPSWENPDPGKGCNATHVARARKKWRTLGRRSQRHTGTWSCKFHIFGHGGNPHKNDEDSRD